MEKHLGGNISKRKAAVTLLAVVIAVTLIWYLRPRPAPHALSKLAPSFNLELSNLNETTLIQLDQAELSCGTDRCPLFLYLKSAVKIECNFEKLTCELRDNSVATPIDVQTIESLKTKWDVYLVYDLDINNFNYNLTDFKPPTKISLGESKKNKNFLFSNSEISERIKKDIAKTITPFNKVVIGTNLDLLFGLIPNIAQLNNEVDAFWKLVFDLKRDLPNVKFSSSLNYEHMRSTNFWAVIDRDSLKKLDFISISTTPLSQKWTEFSKFYSMLYIFTEDKIDLLDNYYDALEEFSSRNIPIVLTEFRFPFEEKDPFKLQSFLDLTNFNKYFNYAPIMIRTDTSPANYVNKTSFRSIEQFNDLKKAF